MSHLTLSKPGNRAAADPLRTTVRASPEPEAFPGQALPDLRVVPVLQVVPELPAGPEVCPVSDPHPALPQDLPSRPLPAAAPDPLLFPVEEPEAACLPQALPQRF